MTVKILIKNADIITCNDSNDVIKNAFLGIKDGYIDFIDTTGEALKGFNADKTIDAENKLVMPGLINAHTHSGMTILRNFANDLALEEWLFNNIFPVEAKLTPEDIYWGTLLGIAND